MLGEWESRLMMLRNQCVGYVCKQFVLRKMSMKIIEIAYSSLLQSFLIDREVSLCKLTWPGAWP